MLNAYLQLFCLIWGFLLQLSFDLHLHGIYFLSSHLQSICIFRSEVGFL